MSGGGKDIGRSLPARPNVLALSQISRLKTGRGRGWNDRAISDGVCEGLGGWAHHG